MLTLAIALTLAQTPQHRLFRQPNLPRTSFAFFEAFPLSGAGTTGACSTTAPTGAKGETLTFTRASSATCTKTATGGLATTGIADGDLVVLNNNVARVEYDSAGTLGLLVEAAGSNLLLRFIEACDAAWSDVGTPALTGATVTGAACATATPQTSPLLGTYATAAVLIEDNDAAAQEGRSQAVTVSAGAAHTMHCYVKAGTLAEASITLDGTAATITGLSATTWSIIQVTDASSSGVSITAQILNGDAVGDTGTVIWGGCDVKTGSYRTSIVPTAGATATRATEGVPTFPVTFAAGSTISAATSINTVFVPTTLTTLAAPPASGNPEILGRFSGGNFGCYMRTPGTDLAAGTWVAGQNRWACSSGRYSALNGTSATGATTTITGALSSVGIGSTGGFGAAVDGIYSRICMDPDPSRCR